MKYGFTKAHTYGVLVIIILCALFAWLYSRIEKNPPNIERLDPPSNADIPTEQMPPSYNVDWGQDKG